MGTQTDSFPCCVFLTTLRGEEWSCVYSFSVFALTVCRLWWIRYVDQGGNKRPGAFAAYLEPWHADIFSFLDLRKNTGMEEARARDLFYALWIPDLFMKRVESNQKWTLMCPAECPGLSDCWGEEFEALYAKYEAEGKGKAIDAQKLWYAIIESQIETGTPYMLYKVHPVPPRSLLVN